MRGTLIRRLIGAAIVLGSQSPTLVRANGGAALQPPPANLRVNGDPASTRVAASALRGSPLVKGDPTAVRLETRGTSVASALAALAAAYHISVRSTVMLDELRDGTYTGSLRYVIGRLLDGYNYVIEENRTATLDVFVVGRSDGKATPSPTMPVFRQHRIPVTYRISRVRP